MVQFFPKNTPFTLSGTDNYVNQTEWPLIQFYSHRHMLDMVAFTAFEVLLQYPKSGASVVTKSFLSSVTSLTQEGRFPQVILSSPGFHCGEDPNIFTPSNVEPLRCSSYPHSLHDLTNLNPSCWTVPILNKERKDLQLWGLSLFEV